jgi:hypothetical protein
VSNRYAVAAVALTAGLQIMTVEFQPLAAVLETHLLGGEDWLLIGGLALVPAVVGQTVKLIAAAGRTFLPPILV